MVGMVGAVPPNTISLQGRLMEVDGVTPKPDGDYVFKAKVFDSALQGNQVWESGDIAGVALKNGIFSLEFGDDQLVGQLVSAPETYYVELEVDGDTFPKAGDPRQKLTTVPYAFYALTASNADTVGGNTVNQIIDQVQAAAGGLTQADADTRYINVDGDTMTGDLELDGFSGKLVREGSDAFGRQADSHVNLGVDSETGAENQDHWGATVGGGRVNTAAAAYSTISGGETNQATNNHTTVGGGQENIASGGLGTIAGGYKNQAEGAYSIISGGRENVAKGSYSTIGGGGYNLAEGRSSTVPGGSENFALGRYSLACGQKAIAQHEGSFVWADSKNEVFSSTAENQFAVRARGGVRLETEGAGLFIDGTQVLEGGDEAGDGHSLDAADGDPADAIYVENSGKVRLKNSLTIFSPRNADSTWNIGGFSIRETTAGNNNDKSWGLLHRAGNSILDAEDQNNLSLIYAYRLNGSDWKYKEYFKIRNNGTVMIPGNVGIGTTPLTKLHAKRESMGMAVKGEAIHNGKTHEGYLGMAGQLTQAGVYGSSPNHGVYGESSTGYGVFGKSAGLGGVRGESEAGTGVYGHSHDATGVYAASVNSFGLQGWSTKMSGVAGYSRGNSGVLGESFSDSKAGVLAKNVSGGPALEIEGGGITMTPTGNKKTGGRTGTQVVETSGYVGTITTDISSNSNLNIVVMNDKVTADSQLFVTVVTPTNLTAINDRIYAQQDGSFSIKLYYDANQLSVATGVKIHYLIIN